MRPMKIYKTYEVVVVPFPFSDKKSTKRRPALVVSSEEYQAKLRHVVLAMITSSLNSEWFLDVEIEDLRKAGLKTPSKVRMKIFTLDDKLILKSIGRLEGKDLSAVRKSLAQVLL